MTRRRRTIAAFFAAFALLFAQLAVSAHVCTLHESPAKAEVMAHHEGCAGSMQKDETPAGDGVCAGHCQYGSASFDNAQPAAAVDTDGPVLRVETPAAAASADARPDWRFALAAAPPPPAILFGVLRI
ncbi:MAG: hypothetical protein IPP91_08195 [Betaproteobacteria bacterium]|nr:hypothetical protein [Betaproteobacteria bacterium]